MDFRKKVISWFELYLLARTFKVNIDKKFSGSGNISNWTRTQNHLARKQHSTIWRKFLHVFIKQKISHLHFLLMQVILAVQSIGDFAISGNVNFVLFIKD